jgi:hypothetical protein
MTEAAAYSPIGVEIGRGRSTRSFGTALAVGLSGIGIAAIWLVGYGALLRVAIPAAALVVGVVLYLNQPIRYVEYSLWVWFLTPLVRRLVDFRFGYTQPSMVLLAPLLVSAVAGLTLVLPGGGAKGRIHPAFVLCGVGILYGFAVGMIIHRSAETVYGLANWLCPLLFGLHLYLNSPHHKQYCQAIGNTFLRAVLVLGLYGIYQYFVAPSWDTYWLTNSQYQAVNPSFGQPEPLLIRVWSTLNSPGPFATTMVVGLLLLFAMRSPWRIPAAIVGYFSRLLSLVRAAWLGWLVGFVLIVAKVKSRLLVRILLSALVVFLCLLPFVTDSRVAPVVTSRFETFADLGHDESFGARSDMYGALIGQIVQNPFGIGLSDETMWHNTPVDSGIISALFSLGWPGAFLFAAGILSALLTSGRIQSRTDAFALVSRAITISLLVGILGGNVLVGITGTMLWTFIAIDLAGGRRSGDQGAPCDAI